MTLSVGLSPRGVAFFYKDLTPKGVILDCKVYRDLFRQ